MSQTVVWNGFTQAELDAAYNNSAAVADSAARIADWTARSAVFRRAHGRELNTAYGSGERQRFDVFRCGAMGAPMLVFIHGGWWQRNSKDVFSCLASGPMARGFDVAMVGYTLAPEASLEGIASEIWAALDRLAAYQREHGATAQVLLSGWSAGGHLTALSLDHPAVLAGLVISGVFDLEPIRHSYINEKLQLDDAMVAAFSPARVVPCGKPLALAFGLDELPELQRQPADYGVWCAKHGQAALGYPLAGHDHFSILEELASPEGALVHLVTALERLAV
jgi:arylformamidase